jgi:hypothetical protein
MKTPPSLGPTGRLETVCVGDNPVMIIVHIRRFCTRSEEGLPVLYHR